ncbi:hypothetical protein ANN_03595 [Periplaneta americana]|uniref:Uncharacterized protein n=1 Tax=Periplaneta americana TaxID=6978 RepID=A0ABQ8TZF1_PERAM|nr:hypothetical protein ANN_03595 [Periplaneta americana]
MGRGVPQFVMNCAYEHSARFVAMTTNVNFVRLVSHHLMFNICSSTDLDEVTGVSQGDAFRLSVSGGPEITRRARPHVRLRTRIRHRSADPGAEPYVEAFQRELRGGTALGWRPQPHQLHKFGKANIYMSRAVLFVPLAYEAKYLSSQFGKEIGLEVNPEKTKYMSMSRDQNIVRKGNIKIGNLSFEEVEKFKYLGATVTNINDTREEIKHRINMGNACYYSVEKILSSSLLSRNLKVRIYKTVILPVVLYGCETWTLTLGEEHRLRVFENKVLRKTIWS